MTDGKETDNASTRRRPSKQLEHLFEKSILGNDMALLEEKRLEEEQKLKEYRAASKEVIICVQLLVMSTLSYVVIVDQHISSSNFLYCA